MCSCKCVVSYCSVSMVVCIVVCCGFLLLWLCVVNCWVIEVLGGGYWYVVE